MKPAIDTSNFNWKKQLRFKYIHEKNMKIDSLFLELGYIEKNWR